MKILAILAAMMPMAMTQQTRVVNTFEYNLKEVNREVVDKDMPVRKMSVSDVSAASMAGPDSDVVKAYLSAVGKTKAWYNVNRGGLANALRAMDMCRDSQIAVSVPGYDCRWIPRQSVPAGAPCPPAQSY